MSYELAELLLEQELLTRELATKEYKEFVPYVNPLYDLRPFHEVCADHLQRFADGEIKKLMITMPPQHGKSELSTRKLPPFLFGRNPDSKGAILSYSADKARKFSREVQLLLTNQRYQLLFPDIRLATGKDEAAVRTMQEFDIVGYRGSLKAVGRRGPLTGDPLDWVILDDLFKDNIEAQSEQLRTQTWEWIETVVETRLHNDSQMVYVTTRWHEEDPSGRFLDRDGYYSESNQDGWVLLNFQALKTDKHIVYYDNRKPGEALWPEKHSKHRLERIQKNTTSTFNALYQGDPKPSEESVIFSDWIEIDDDQLPEYFDHEFNVIDFGYSNDPTAAVKVGRVANSLYLDEKFYETGLTNQDILIWFYALGLDPQAETICDRAEPKSVEELKRGFYNKKTETQYNGINARACDKGAGSIVGGISKLKEYTVYVTKRSRSLIKEKNNYTWIMANGKATNKPIDRWNHGIDAVRSGVYTLYGQPMPVGGTVSRPPGKRPMGL